MGGVAVEDVTVEDEAVEVVADVVIEAAEDVIVADVPPDNSDVVGCVVVVD